MTVPGITHGTHPVILGNMNPGTYTVYVVTSPIDRERFGHGGYAKADITFLPPETEPAQCPFARV